MTNIVQVDNIDHFVSLDKCKAWFEPNSTTTIKGVSREDMNVSNKIVSDMTSKLLEPLADYWGTPCSTGNFIIMGGFQNRVFESLSSELGSELSPIKGDIDVYLFNLNEYTTAIKYLDNVLSRLLVSDKVYTSSILERVNCYLFETTYTTQKVDLVHRFLDYRDPDSILETFDFCHSLPILENIDAKFQQYRALALYCIVNKVLLINPMLYKMDTLTEDKLMKRIVKFVDEGWYLTENVIDFYCKTFHTNREYFEDKLKSDLEYKRKFLSHQQRSTSY